MSIIATVSSTVPTTRPCPINMPPRRRKVAEIKEEFIVQESSSSSSSSSSSASNPPLSPTLSTCSNGTLPAMLYRPHYLTGLALLIGYLLKVAFFSNAPHRDTILQYIIYIYILLAFFLFYSIGVFQWPCCVLYS